jgi:hypothetical protein
MPETAILARSLRGCSRPFRHRFLKRGFQQPVTQTNDPDPFYSNRFEQDHVSQLVHQMTPSDFVDALKSEVLDEAAAGTISEIKTPSGRRPSDAIRKLSTWFNLLSEADQKAVAEVAAISAHSAVFGFLCVLDGVRVIEDEEPRGEFELNYVQQGKAKVRLNPSSGDFLHDLLNAES